MATGRWMRRASRARALAVVAILVGATALGGLASRLGGTLPACPARGAAVVLDPGHGGAEPGAVNEAFGLVERDLVLVIARRTAALLRAEGIPVALTHDGGGATLGNTPRGQIANACRALVFVSIHLNSFGEPDPNYAKTFWGAAEKDLAFAGAMQAVLAADLAPGTNLGDGGTEQLENGGLLAARMPAALVEPVFLSNPDEAARLAGGDRADRIADAIARGVAGWLGRLGPLTGAGTAPTAGGGAFSPSDPLFASPRGTAEWAIAAAEAAGARRLPEVRAYVAEVYRLGPTIGVDPAVVVAQSAHETGFWRSPAWGDHLNPAGIGITGPGAPSPTWGGGTEAARAQIVHLYLYAAGEIGPGHPLAPYLPLDPRYEAARSAGRAGTARTIGDLSGRRATDPRYAEGIARAADRLFGPG